MMSEKVSWLLLESEAKVETSSRASPNVCFALATKLPQPRQLSDKALPRFDRPRLVSLQRKEPHNKGM